VTGILNLSNITANISTAWTPISATGGNISNIVVDSTTYRVHIFANVGTENFVVTSVGTSDAMIDYLIVGGGGGGGMDMGGGGGGGGVLMGNVKVQANTYPVVVGAGGWGAPGGSQTRGDGAGPQPGVHQFTIPATAGNSSSAFGLTANGGGIGGSSVYNFTPGATGGAGASGGGASGYANTSGNTAVGGNAIPGQGYAGGRGGGQYFSGGGGGAGGPGTPSTYFSNGGPGLRSDILGRPLYWGGGGGGAGYSQIGGSGGIGGGGGGAVGTTYGGQGFNNGNAGGGGGTVSQANTRGGNAAPNTGGGGGGSAHYNANNPGGNGGSGIVIVRYPLEQPSQLRVTSGVALTSPTGIVQCVTKRSDTRAIIQAPNTNRPQPLDDLGLTITPRSADSMLMMRWMLSGEGHYDTSFVVTRENSVIYTPDYQSFNEQAGYQRWSGIASPWYDVNDQNSTPTVIFVQYMVPALDTTIRTYYPAIKSSSGTNYTWAQNCALGSVGADNFEVSVSAGWIWEIANDPVISQPPVTDFVARYTGSSYQAGTGWLDISGNGNDVTTIGGTPRQVAAVIGNNSQGQFTVLQGDTAATLLWPANILPTTYTLFHVCRYNGTERRILQGDANNWLSGFWSGNAGVAFHEGWLSPQTDYFTTNWVLSTDMRSYYRGYSNGVTNTFTSGGNASARLALNRGANSTETSDWQIAEIIVYDRELSESERKNMEIWLKMKYRL
jgi:hypothetical protein